MRLTIFFVLLVAAGLAKAAADQLSFMQSHPLAALADALPSADTLTALSLAWSIFSAFVP